MPLQQTPVKFGDMVDKVIGKNLRIFPILFTQFKHLQYAFFDSKQMNGEGAMSIDIRTVPGITPSLTVDGFSVAWADHSIADFNTTVGVAATPITLTAGAGTFPVADTSGFSKNDHILILKGATANEDEVEIIVRRIVNGTSFEGEVIRHNGSETIPASVKIKEGQQVERLYNPRNDNDVDFKAVYTPGYKEYKSYIQHFTRTLTFTKAELNKIYTYEGMAAKEVENKFKFAVSVIFQEINKAIYKGRNRGPGAGEFDKMEMLGLETAVNHCGTRFTVTNPANAVNDLYGQISLAYQSGIIGTGDPLMLLCNTQFISELAKADRDKIRYTDKVVEKLNYEVKQINTPFGSATLVVDQAMRTLYPTGTAFIVPRSMISLFVRENDVGDHKEKFVTRADRSIRVDEWVTRAKESRTFDITVELGMIIGGLSLGKNAPIRMITNFTIA